MKKQFRDFEEARDFVRKLNLKGYRGWEEYCKSGKKPKDIPMDPRRTYEKDWKTMKNWLGSEWCSFKEARDFVRKLKLKNIQEWYDYCKSGDKPDDIPVRFDQVYKKEYQGVGDLLGTGFVASKNRIYLSFTESRNFVRSLNLKNHKEWVAYCKSGDKPDDIPSSPIHVYKKEYVDLGNWLGTGIAATRKKQFCSFTEAREFVRGLGLKNRKEWIDYCKSGDKPNDIPVKPWKTYKEWKKK
jgi:hypothetical protein